MFAMLKLWWQMLLSSPEERIGVLVAPEDSRLWWEGGCKFFDTFDGRHGVWMNNGRLLIEVGWFTWEEVQPWLADNSQATTQAPDYPPPLPHH